MLRALGAEPDPLTGRIAPPSESAFRRTLAEVDADHLQRLTSRWITATMTGSHDHDDGPVGDEGASVEEVASAGEVVGASAGVGGDRDGHEWCDEDARAGGRRLFGVAFDGKCVRGAAAGGNPRPHLLAAASHDGSIVLAQRQIPDKGSEIAELTKLVADMDLRGKIATVDACTPSGPPRTVRCLSSRPADAFGCLRCLWRRAWSYRPL